MNPLRPIENLLEWALNGLHTGVGLTYGWAIVVLTLIVRAALLPLVIKQYRSLRQMQIIAPQLKEVQRKYKDDRRKQQEEVMRLYQEHNANPFASCLPMVAQLPVFFALYYVLRGFSGSVDSDGTARSFLWIIPDITTHLKDLSVLALVIGLGIYGLSQLLSTELSFEPHTPATQRRIMRLLPIPIVLTALQFPFPAGLGIYWVTTNLWTAGQMLIIKHIIGLHIAHNPDEVPGGPKSSRTPSAKAKGEVGGGGTRAGARNDVPVAADVAPAVSDPGMSAPVSEGPGRRKPRPRGGAQGSGGNARTRRPPKKRR